MTTQVTAAGSLDTPPEARPHTPMRLTPGRALALPLTCAAGLLALTALPSVHQHDRLLGAFVAAALGIAAWAGALMVSSIRARRVLSLDIALRPQHYVQAGAHAAILLYWGWYWRQVYDSAHLIAAQVVFAYAVDMLITWSRRKPYVLGFGPLPIVFSTNLFLWFRDDWFAFQFLMIAAGFAGKALIAWRKDGRRVHIFNPSAVALATASVILLAAGATDLTWGPEIAVTQFYPPHMYLFLFLVSLPGQALFGVASMTMAAVATTYGLGLTYFAATGTYFFIDSYIPIAVFLGMHLLFTDPSTSPRTDLGRLMFGALYGASVVALYALLGRAGLPAFYDKLLPVPLLNLAIQAIDRAARSRWLRPLAPERLAPGFTARQRALAYAAAWAIIFGTMSAAQGVGDGHQGQWLPFWREACRAGRPGACTYLPQLETTLCRAGSGWACNELGIFRSEHEDNPIAALASWQRGCELGFGPSCTNADGRGAAGRAATALPPLADLPILVRGSKGPVVDHNPAALRARACEAGWAEFCGAVK